jgi:hypothetical protein
MHILNTELQTTDKNGLPALGLGRGLITPHHKNDIQVPIPTYTEINLQVP